MWKKMIPILVSALLCTILATSVVGASKDATSPNDPDNISFETDKEQYTPNETIFLSLKNNSPYAISFGMPYAIDVLKDGKWQRTSLTDDLMFTQQILTLSPKETYDTAVDLNIFKDKLSPGYYRIVKLVHIGEKPVEIGAEFEIVKETFK
ncbi:immunoglobulin-like domain-containing protein [Aliibacillus thermotolerans]|uniref:Immunoglobulin-like domain-containing protein n=1 Tax=Aliibacillus thermotolerans TaxID=1834418 RepID=A0ABW0U7X0_9BACI|nr:immunoglobulin-like domain-containing protein [Aliibacillus thermotolerans]MDA3129290.1 hypothetical protein [Aliibacillus thermotolerans]